MEDWKYCSWCNFWYFCGRNCDINCKAEVNHFKCGSLFAFSTSEYEESEILPSYLFYLNWGFFRYIKNLGVISPHPSDILNSARKF